MKTTKSLDEHILNYKGYEFDSLVYRFKDYQSRAYNAEVDEYKYKYHCGTMEARMKVKDMHDRDLMRFIQILDEAMGEHN